MTMPKITTKLAGDCAGRDCPAVWATDDPATVGIQGAIAGPASLEAANGIPSDESVVFVPASLLAAWASAQS
jgi:hypothetical protein